MHRLCENQETIPNHMTDSINGVICLRLILFCLFRSFFFFLVDLFVVLAAYICIRMERFNIVGVYIFMTGVCLRGCVSWRGVAKVGKVR